MQPTDWKDITPSEMDALPWHSSHKTTNVEELFVQVGCLITCWEGMLSDAAELFDLLATPPGQKSNRLAFLAFSEISSPASQANLLRRAAKYGCASEGGKERISKIADWIDRLLIRRNEVAHGRAFNLDDLGYALGPNNISPKKWRSDGAAKYQLTAASIERSRTAIVALHDNILYLIDAVQREDRD